MVPAQTAAADIENITSTVVEKVAEVEDVDPLELTPPLYEVIDSDALERLFAANQAVRQVVFKYNDYNVNISAEGSVSVESDGT